MLRTGRAWKFGVGMALAAGAWACEAGMDNESPTIDTAIPEEATPSSTDTTAERTDAEITVADIVGEPETYYGRRVTLEADVDDVIGPRAFALDEDAPLAGGIDNDLVVLAREPLPTGALDDEWVDQRVRVTGTVARLDVVEIERELDWDLNPEIETELEDRRAVLIAESVSRVGQ